MPRLPRLQYENAIYRVVTRGDGRRRLFQVKAPVEAVIAATAGEYGVDPEDYHNGKQMLRAGVESLGLSARAHDKILRVARTIADIEGSDAIGEEHLGEAISYRNLDADLWV